MTQQLPFGDGELSAWPAGAPPRYGYLVAWDGPPAPRGVLADIVLDGAGVYLATSTADLAVRVRLAQATIPDLPVVATGVTLARGLIDASLWDALVERARAAMPHEILLAIIAREPGEGELFVAAAGVYTLVEPQLDETGAGIWQPQQTSGCSVRATPVSGAVVEVHSHHAMRAYFSPTDNRDETARRVYGVVGRLDGPTPEIALRVATGCKPQAIERVSFEQVFAGGLGAFRNVHGPDEAAAAPQAGARSWRPPRLCGPDAASVLTPLLLGMADELAAIRDRLEAGPATPDPATAPFWSAR